MTRKSERVEVTPSGREIDIQFAYDTPLMPGGNLSTWLLMQLEPGHDAEAEPAYGAGCKVPPHVLGTGPIYMTLRSLAALGCLLSVACGGGHSDKLPPGAIAVGEDLYMVPLAKPVGGCPAFRAFSPDKMVVQAIYFRTIEGRFVMSRQEAGCT